MFHVPNKNDSRALCSTKLPLPTNRENAEDPQLQDRCSMCETERLRLESRFESRRIIQAARSIVKETRPFGEIAGPAGKSNPSRSENDE